MTWRATAVTCAAVAALLAGTHWAIYQHGRSTMRAEQDAIISEMAASAAKANESAIEAARQTEQALAARINQIEARHHDEIQAANDERDLLLSAVRSGEQRVRERFTCQADRAGSSVSDSAARSGVNQPAKTGGLQRADAEFLVRLANEADAVARQLQACQTMLQADRIR